MENIFETKKPFQLYLTMAVPLIITQLVGLLYNIADTYFVSYAQDAMLVAAVSLCAPLMIIQMAFGNLMSQGTSSRISRLLGSQDRDGIRRATSFAFFGALGLSVLLGAVLLLLRQPMLNLMGADENTMDAAIAYYNVIALGSPFMVLNYVPANLMRAEGLSREAMYSSTLGAVVNLVLDPLLILWLHLGAFGAALATVVANAASVIFGLVMIARRSQNMRIRPAYIRCGREAVRDILALGFAATAMNLLSALSDMLSNRALQIYGSDKIASMGIAVKISSVPYSILIGLTFALAPVIGYYYGAKDRERMHLVLKQVTLFELSFAAVMAVAIALLAPVLVPCFLKAQEIVSVATVMLRIRISTFPLIAVHMLVMILFQSLGKAKYAMVTSLTRQGILFIIVLFVMQRLFGFTGVLWVNPISNVLAAAIALVLLYKIRSEI